MYYGTVGTIKASVALLATALVPILERTYGKQVARRPLLRSLHGLLKRHVIHFDHQQQRWQLTDTGIRRVRTYFIRDLALPKRPRQWDGQWHLIAFDIPERSRYLRILFQRKLRLLGLTYLQRSLWIYPFSCERQIQDLALRLGLEHDIVVVIASRIQPDARLRKKYRLPAPGNLPHSIDR